jgi:protein-disulfide isomerase-like protein with CxxC motif
MRVGLASSIEAAQVFLREDLAGQLAQLERGILESRLGALLQRIHHDELRRTQLPAKIAEVLIAAGLQQAMIAAVTPVVIPAARSDQLDARAVRQLAKGSFSK